MQPETTAHRPLSRHSSLYLSEALGTTLPLHLAIHEEVNLLPHVSQQRFDAVQPFAVARYGKLSPLTSGILVFPALTAFAVAS
jgi:hypothetical protein